MKKIVLPVLIAMVMPAMMSCSGTRLGGYTLNQADAASALKQMLEFGARQSITGSFSKDAILGTLFPENLRKTLNTLQTLGLSGEVDRFTATLGTAAEKTAERSVPIFVNGISRISFTDAIQIVKNGGTSATQYLKSSIGPELRTSIQPVMKSALDEYKLTDQWNKIIKPAQALLGNKINLDLSNLMAGLVAEKMFQKLEEKETQIRQDAAARTTPLLQKVFSRNWN